MPRGRKPKPEAPQAPTTRPDPPKDLDKAAKAVWSSVCEDLENLGTLQSVDRKLIEVYARDYALCQRISGQLANEPLAKEAANGRQFINPLLSSYTTMTTKLRQTLNDLGLTPYARKAKANLTSTANPYSSMTEI